MQVSALHDHDQAAVSVAGSGCSFVYQLDAGGVSHLFDPTGADWIRFAPGEPSVPGGAAHIFRGLPNMVHPDNIGHPGHAHCRTTAEDGALLTKSRDGLWGWRVEMRGRWLVFDVHTVPEDRRYWFLYEGPPAGQYTPAEIVWGTNMGEGGALPEIRAGRDSMTYPTVRWAYVGLRGHPWLLVIAAHGDPAPSMLCRMNADDLEPEPANGMVVFGLGRGPKTSSLLRGPRTFAAGFIQAAGDHAARAGRIESELAGLREDR
jgi:hypothetical protein